MKKIKILGAGVSGLTAAINLAKAGYKVDVYELNKDVGLRFHGDIQGLENWSEKKEILEQLNEMGLEINFDCDPFSKLVVTNTVLTKEIDNGKPLYYLIKRGSFKGTLDYGLKQQALKAGVNINFKKTIPPDKADIVGTGPILREVAAVDKGITFRTNAKDVSVLVLNDKLSYEGYSYLLITKGYGCMCTVVFDELKKVNNCFDETKKFFKNYHFKNLRLNIKSPRLAGGIGSFSLKHPFKAVHQKEETLYVGEAAGLQDFLWGFGMRFAMESGYLAAQSIIKNEDYKELANKQFSRRLKASMVNRYLWEKFGRKAAYSLIVKHAGFVMNRLYSFHNYNLLQKLIYPFALSYLKKEYPTIKL